jgi:hypothetical protein
MKDYKSKQRLRPRWAACFFRRQPPDWLALPALATIKSTLPTGESFAVSDPAGQRREGESMKNPLDSLWGTVISGLILTVILYFVVKSILS